MIRTAICLVALTAAAPAAAGIFDAAGPWLGEGRLATGPTAPLERGRCRVEVAPAGPDDVSVTGRCAVAAGTSTISLRLVRDGTGKLRAGFWSAATGQTIQLAGTEAGGAIELGSTTPLIDHGRRYETRVSVSEQAGGFAIRQLLREEGEAAWRLVGEMSYRPAGS